MARIYATLVGTVLFLLGLVGLLLGETLKKLSEPQNGPKCACSLHTKV